MRILLAIISVALFGAVAVAITAVPRSNLVVPKSVPPRYTPMPAVETTPPDVGDQAVRHDTRLWAMFALPLEGGAVPTDTELLPGAPRDYRAGVHEGMDFPAADGTPVLAAASGTVVRADTSFADWTRAEQDGALVEALALGYTPTATLDRIRGRQVWIDHGRGVITRYAHLSAVEALTVGQKVEAGALIGAVGSSGYPQGGPHLHFEVRVGDDFYGDGLAGEALVRAIARLFR